MLSILVVSEDPATGEPGTKSPPPLFLFLYVRNFTHGSEFAPVKKLHTLSALRDREFRLLFPTLGLAAGMKD